MDQSERSSLKRRLSWKGIGPLHPGRKWDHQLVAWARLCSAMAATRASRRADEPASALIMVAVQVDRIASIS